MWAETTSENIGYATEESSVNKWVWLHRGSKNGTNQQPIARPSWHSFSQTINHHWQAKLPFLVMYRFQKNKSTLAMEYKPLQWCVSSSAWIRWTLVNHYSKIEVTRDSIASHLWVPQLKHLYLGSLRPPAKSKMVASWPSSPTCACVRRYRPMDSWVQLTPVPKLGQFCWLKTTIEKLTEFETYQTQTANW